jgi:hypothetical protein
MVVDPEGEVFLFQGLIVSKEELAKLGIVVQEKPTTPTSGST